MSGSSLALTEFLLARIAEDEAVARAACEGPWRRGITHTGLVSVEGPPWTVAADLVVTDAVHIARHDPARVLAECEAKRQIVERQGGVNRAALISLASVYADHSDYQQEWKP